MSNQRLMKAKEKAGDGYAKTNAIAPPLDGVADVQGRVTNLPPAESNVVLCVPGLEQT